MSQLLITIPHSGEKVPEEAAWLKSLPEEILMCDVDRYVDVLYEPTISALKIPYVKTEWHRYAVDLNRVPGDVDAKSVLGHKNSPGMHNRGYHWQVTTKNDVLLKEPISQELHEKLTALIYTPFHEKIRAQYSEISKTQKEIFHLDAHSMPSVGTKMHKDPGEKRAEIVVSDCLGKSCKSAFRDLVIAAYCTAGFRVAYNWPYVGGRVTEQYGNPAQGHHAIQVEISRELYMDEETKKIKSSLVPEVQKRSKKPWST